MEFHSKGLPLQDITALMCDLTNLNPTFFLNLQLGCAGKRSPGVLTSVDSAMHVLHSFRHIRCILK